MGSWPWWCSTPFKEPLQQTLHEVRHREFLERMLAENNTQYDSEEAIEEGIAELIEECDADGTCSILDIETISETPDDMECGCACPLSKERLIELFGTDKPDSEVLSDDENEALDDLYESIGRGQAVYVIGYAESGKPDEIHFFGMSYD